MLSGTLENILLVDDDVDHLCICSLILRRQNYTVRTLAGCHNMEDLLETVRSFRPRLIFMDHDMPGVCGVDATKILKSDPLLKFIPIIYFSGQDNVDQLAAAAGADDFLRKNVYMPKLLEITARYTV
jgi:two-component system alkaline phosphatase synthesis response regulator PhoP